MINKDIATTYSIPIGQDILRIAKIPRPTAGFTEHRMIHLTIAEGGFVKSRTEIPINKDIYEELKPLFKEESPR